MELPGPAGADATVGSQQPGEFKPIRALVITLGGEREKIIRQHFEAVGGFELHFSQGVPSRSVRTKQGLKTAIDECGLFGGNSNSDTTTSRGGCGGRADSSVSRGSVGDGETVTSASTTSGTTPEEYTFENLWRDCRSINRQRAVLACLLAHVRALKRAQEIPGGIDVIFEDNVRFLRAPLESARRIRELQKQSPDASVRLFGFGAPDSITEHLFAAAGKGATMAPFLFGRKPLQTPSVDTDAGTQASTARGHGVSTASSEESTATGAASRESEIESEPMAVVRGKPLVWGCFAYWVHSLVLERFLLRLRSELPLSLLFKRNKRQKCYHIRPFDKILFEFGLPERLGPSPRQAVVSLKPCCYRAPMLPSSFFVAKAMELPSRCCFCCWLLCSLCLSSV